MHEQMYLLSPFGLERVHADHHFVDGWGWAWAVTIYDGHEWGTVDSGYAGSDRKALRSIAACLEQLAEYEDVDDVIEDYF